MPYVIKNVRSVLDEIPLAEIGRSCVSPGHLNYAFSVIAREYLRAHGVSYDKINDVIGALEGAKLEFYARVARPYEDTKIAANGDVYDKED